MEKFRLIHVKGDIAAFKKSEVKFKLVKIRGLLRWFSFGANLLATTERANARLKITEQKLLI